MAYVQLDGPEKPCFEKTLTRDLCHDVIEQLCLMLNPVLATKDYRSLAGKMGMKFWYVKNLDRKENPTEELLQNWLSGEGSKFVTDLIDLLKQINRYDAVDLLQEHEYTVKQRSQRPASTLSGSSTKEPCENESSDASPYCISDDEGSRYPRFNDFGSSVPSYAEPPASYVSSNPSDSSTVCADGYDTDEELNHKMEAMGAGPCETTDDSTCHPVYQFRKREGSNASTSTGGSAYTSTSTKSGSVSVDTGMQTDAISVHSVDVHPRPPILTSPMAADPAPMFIQPPIVASDKLALLIGNRNYKKLEEEELKFPHKDVFDLSRELSDLGFKVLSLVDLTLTEMRTVMLAFCKLLGPGVFAVFYFAGHGYEENGENYLMPIDASPARSSHEFIAAQEILVEMQLRQTALNLQIIDACRVKGVTGEGKTGGGGLRKGALGNTIIAYSCQSQMPAFESQLQTNGVYMTELLKKIKEDRRIEHILMDVNCAVHGNPHVIQRPVFESDTIGDCRLTCKIDTHANFNLWHDRSDKWCAAAMPPDPQVFEREEENLVFTLEYISNFSNMLQVNVHVCNKNTVPIQIHEIRLLNGADLDIHPNQLELVVQPGNSWTEIQQYRIRDLQKLKSELLLVLQLKTQLFADPDFALIEFKLNADFPLVSSYLNDFRKWITNEQLSGHGKNTWV